MARALVPWAAGLWLFANSCGQSPKRFPPEVYERCPNLRGFPDAVPVQSDPYGACSGANAYFYVDADCDGSGSTVGVTVPCVNGRAPIGYSWNDRDCDDSNPTRWRVYDRDADGDGVGAQDVTVCAGADRPPGYVEETYLGDCDDTNPAISYPYRRDADGDGVPAPNAPIVCGPKGQTPLAAVDFYCGSDYRPCDDCDDNDPSIRTLYYQDLDGDGYAAGTAVSACGSPAGPPPAFGILGDCDDTRAGVSPAALELWSDDVDSDCDGKINPFPSCYDARLCTPGTVPVDSTCDVGDLVITHSRLISICGYRQGWGLSIANQGTGLISEYALTIASLDRTTVFQIRDPLAPGAEYPYQIPPGLPLSGNVRFSVGSTSPDCNPANNSAEDAVLDLMACPP